MSSFSNFATRTPPPFESAPKEEDYSYGNRKRSTPYESSSKRSYPHSSPNPSHYGHSSDFENPINNKVITLPYSLLIPNELIGFLIGTNGSVIREIEHSSSSILYFEKSRFSNKNQSPSFNDNLSNNHETSSHAHNSPKQSPDDHQETISDKILLIFGTTHQKNAAVDHILRRIKSLRPLQDSDAKDAIIIAVPANSLSLLIGHRGQTINDISRKSQCEIIVQKKNLNTSSGKAVSIRSSDISGLVNCISMIYSAFESFVSQRKLQQDDFILLQDETAFQYARKVSESVVNDPPFRFSPVNAPMDVPFYGRGPQGPPYKQRALSPSPSDPRMMFDDAYRNSPSRPSEKLVKYNFGQKIPFPLDLKEPPYRDEPHDLYPSQSSHKGQDYFDKSLDPPGYNQSYRPIKQLRRKGYYGDDSHNSPRFNGKDDLSPMPGEGPAPIPLDPSQPFPMSPYPPTRMQYPSRMPDPGPIHQDHIRNLLEHPFSKFHTDFDLKFVVQADTAAWVVGKKGDHIKEAKRLSGADISVSDAKSSIPGLEADERLLTVSGSILAKFKAFELLISPMLARLANSHKPVRLLLPTKSVSFVIGLSGGTINQITHESKAEVNVEKSLLIDGARPVTISGPPNAQLAAALLLFEKVEEFYNPEIAEQKLHIPLIPIAYNSPIHHPPSYNSTHHLNENNRDGANSRDGPPPHYIH